MMMAQVKTLAEKTIDVRKVIANRPSTRAFTFNAVKQLLSNRPLHRQRAPTPRKRSS